MSRTLALFSVLILAACSQETLAPADGLDPSFAKAAAAPAFQGGCNGAGDVTADGLRHFPLGKAKLSVDGNGDVVVSNFHKAGQDGACTRLPRVDGVFIGFPMNESMSDIFGAVIERIIAANGAQVFEASLRLRPNGRLAGYMDYSEDSCMNTVVVRHNGQPVRSRAGTGRVRFTLPADFRLGQWSFRGGIGMIRGLDGAGTTWSVTGTPDAACRKTPKLGAAINLFGGSGGGSVTLSWATFPSD